MGVIDVSKFIMLIIPGVIGMGFGTFVGKNIFKHIKSDTYFSSILALIVVIAMFWFD